MLIGDRRLYSGVEGIYVGRPTAWGNPYRVVGRLGRVEAVALYRRWLLNMLRDEPTRFEALMISLRAALGNYESPVLLCWCVGGAEGTDHEMVRGECHAAVLAAAYEWWVGRQ